jgi:hypothetical protein
MNTEKEIQNKWLGGIQNKWLREFEMECGDLSRIHVKEHLTNANDRDTPNVSSHITS